MEIGNLILVAALITLTGFFVAIEFAIVKVRSSRIDQLVGEKKRGAVAAKKVISNLDEYLSACQFGITITALGLGWLGEPTVKHVLEPVLITLQISPPIANTVSFIIAFAVITFLHVVVGELAPKTFAIQKAEQVSLMFSKPLIYFYRIMYPFIWTLNHAARFVASLFGLKPASEYEVAHSEEELRLILSESYESGEINQAEFKYVNNIFEFDNRLAKEIMVPRTEIVGLYAEDLFETHIEMIRQEKYTRYPVFGEDKDEVIGMVNVKDFFIRYMDGEKQEAKSITTYTRPVIEVMENIPIHDLLLSMQKKRIPLAILYDEYGGTAGLVTLEDILEEIVGEIRDEYDEDEHPPIQHISDDCKIVDGKVLVSEINDLFGLHLNEQDVDTIGGWLMMQGQPIAEGDTTVVGEWTFTILEKDIHQIKRVEIKKMETKEKG
ncbi:hemolysin family protein [Bacillus sp. NPDC077411]|uniref:hemolysin family protein n=1 Tax=unclassified Bacillus (in: firmicutes) TaxID=185979 RepID=UPI0008F05620|nr:MULTISPECIES: hemolysin family protein [unclassified Bacillus (in: firmicutes)]SFJ56352.1 Hemolysin, contains CBS domains [Bacillus sp. 71mf]SFT06538.1 Hemolysin, contains CBS domains [Bacillus sp. 103mf]